MTSGSSAHMRIVTGSVCRRLFGLDAEICPNSPLWARGTMHQGSCCRHEEVPTAFLVFEGGGAVLTPESLAARSFENPYTLLLTRTQIISAYVPKSRWIRSASPHTPASRGWQARRGPPNPGLGFAAETPRHRLCPSRAAGNGLLYLPEWFLLSAARSTMPSVAPSR